MLGNGLRIKLNVERSTYVMGRKRNLIAVEKPKIEVLADKNFARKEISATIKRSVSAVIAYLTRMYYPVAPKRRGPKKKLPRGRKV